MSTLFMPGRARVASKALRDVRRPRHLRGIAEHDRRVLAAVEAARLTRSGG